LKSGEQGIVEPGKAPTKTAAIYTTSIIQWCLYYPAVLDLNDLNFTDAEKQALAASLEAYRSGDLLAALAAYPANREPASDAKRPYLAALLLPVAQVAAVEKVLTPNSAVTPATPLLELISAVKHQPWTPRTLTTASDWLANSYRRQADLDLEGALASARMSAE